MTKQTKDLLDRYGISLEGMNGLTDTMLFSFLLLIRAADNFDNTNNTILYNSCGEIGAPDGTHYQVQLLIVPEKKDWIPSEGVYFSTPIEDNPNIN